MQIISSIHSIIDLKRPRQGIGDLWKAGFDNALLDFSALCTSETLEHLGEIRLKNSCGTMVAQDPGLLKEYAHAWADQCRSRDLVLSVARAPFLAEDSKRHDLQRTISALAIESIKFCGEISCPYLIIRFPCITENSHDFYLSLAKTARENHVTILLENQCRDIGGHLVRGFCADEQEAAARVDGLNRSASERYGPWNGQTEQEVVGSGPHMTGQQDNYFGFCMDVGACNLCGQNMYDFAVALGDRIKAVVLRDCDGSSDASLLPFTCVKKGQTQTDWLNLIRGLRRIRFDGCLIMDYADTAAACSPILKPHLLALAKAQGDYFAWQIGMERMLEQYSSRVLFGAGNMCRNYMKNYGDAYPPLFTCDNNKSLWDTDFCGLTVRSPEALKSLPSDCAIFICNIYYREIEAQLKDMGLPNPIVYFNDEYMPTFYVDRLDSMTRKCDGQL